MASSARAVAVERSDPVQAKSDERDSNGYQKKQCRDRSRITITPRRIPSRGVVERESSGLIIVGVVESRIKSPEPRNPAQFRSINYHTDDFRKN